MTAEESQILDQWRKYWHLELCKKIGVFDHYTEAFVRALSERTPKLERTLEVGPGLTEIAHLLSDSRTDAIDVDPFFAAELAKAFPECNVIVGDIQSDTLALPPEAFDRVVAFHVLEHLRDLPTAVLQIKNSMRPGGFFDVMLPCEGGRMYMLGRRVTTARIFKKKFKRDFAKFIAHDHVNTAAEVLEVLKAHFDTGYTAYYPTMVPSVHVNLCVGIRFIKR